MSTRLIVKNLPKYITPERVKEHFEQKGEITDVKFGYTADKKFRRFAFVGFRTAKEAKSAQKFFEGTYIDTSKISVEFAKAVGDPTLPRAWSKHTKGTTAYHRTPAGARELEEKLEAARLERVKALNQATEAETSRKAAMLKALYEAESALEGSSGDPKLREFMEVVGHASKATWGNDDGVVSVEATKKIKKVGGTIAEVLAVENKKPGGKGMLLTKTHVKFGGDEDEDGESDDEYQTIPGLDAKEEGKAETPDEPKVAPTPETQDAEEVNANAVAFDSGLSDMDYLRMKMRRRLDDEDDPMDDAPPSSSFFNKFHRAAETSDDDGENISDPENEMDIDDADKQEDESAAQTNQSTDALAQQPDAAPDSIEAVLSKLSSSGISIASTSAPTANPAVGLPHRPTTPPPASVIADTARLFIQNLPYAATVQDLTSTFSRFGPLAEPPHIPVSRDTHAPKGYAFVRFLMPEHAAKALDAMDGSIFMGRVMKVLAGKERPGKDGDEEEDTGASFKEKKEKEKKKVAGREGTWNSLFMNVSIYLPSGLLMRFVQHFSVLILEQSDSVMEAMAKKLGVTKSEILSPDADNLAVRVALAETEIVAETKEYLEREGIVLDAFEGGKRKVRSDTVLLVKNIPYTTEEAELSDVFGKFGQVGRIVLPPTRTIALVEFTDPGNARSAFRRLAFSKFKHLPLFLEWAPTGVFKSEFDPAIHTRKETKPKHTDPTTDMDADDSSVKSALSSALPSQISKKDDDEVEEDDIPNVVASVYVKNLSFSTTEAVLREAFSGCRGLRSVRIPKKTDAKTGNRLSMGFGFLEFSGREEAKSVLKSMQGFVLDGHTLQLKLSNAATKGADASAASRKRKGEEDKGVEVTGSKLIVRNIPFQATKKDLRQLFAPFGTLKSLRLPKKHDHTPRGFAFVDFLTTQEARSAFSALSSTHLYGRRLVMEWAKVGEDEEEKVEEIRRRVGRGFEALAKSEGRKRRKVEMGGEGEEGAAAGEDDDDE
ncbi:hypothetical protein BJ742DRAFT_716186 [Cladochytrium replicatum]|nr:hypothetical protein BJ742DRAFT_716186 [Cladochytrium replicatum]